MEIEKIKYGILIDEVDEGCEESQTTKDVHLLMDALELWDDEERMKDALREVRKIGNKAKQVAEFADRVYKIFSHV